MTTRALKAHPKVYSIWNHRRWCLQHIPDEPNEDWKKASWDKELFVVERMLEADSRNCELHISISNIFLDCTPVHAWSYRRYVLASMPARRSETSELAYTRKMIEANFSNFSAWHQRSKVLSILWSSGQLDSRKSKEEGDSRNLFTFGFDNLGS
jgi:geranylgeranyl transferase type-2 subunit alpha